MIISEMIKKINNINIDAWELRKKDKEKSLNLSKKAYLLSRKVHYECGIGESIITIGYNFFEKGDYLKSIKKLNEAYDIFERQNYIDGKIKYFYTIGIVYSQMCNYIEALDYNLKGLALARESNNKMLSHFLNNIGVIYANSMNMYEESLNYFFEAISLSENLNNGLILNNIGDTYFYLGNTKKALEYCQKGLKIAQASCDKYTEGLSHKYMGKIYKKSGNMEMSLESFSKSLLIFEELKNIYQQSEVLADLGSFYLDINNDNTSLDYLNRALELAEGINANFELITIHYLLGKLYDKNNNAVKSLFHYKKYIELKENLETQELKNKLNTISVNTKIEKIKNDSEIYRLKNIELKEKSEEIQQKSRELETSYKNVAIIGEIGQKITSSLDIETILNTIYENVNVLMDATGFGIDLYDEENGIIDYIMFIENGVRLPRFQATIDTENSYAAKCIKTKESFILNNVDPNSSNNYTDENTEEGYKPILSVIYCPLIIEKKVLGAVSVQSYNKNAYSEINFDTIKALASYIAIAVNNSQKNEELSITLKNLKETQEYLIQSEKMAALGQLISGIAHEINTPLGAIQASVNNITEYMSGIEEKMPNILKLLDEDLQKIFFKMLKNTLLKDISISSKEERKYKRQIRYMLEDLSIEDSDSISDTLVDMGIYENIQEYLPLLQHTENQLILQVCYEISGIVRNTKNMDVAVGKASKMIYALKSYAHFDQTETPIEADIQKGIETVLSLYSNNLKHGINVIKKYSDIPKIECYPDELNQVWTNLIYNALQAMDYKGTLEISTHLEGEYVVIKITDSGAGIPEEVKAKIFEPFFTTKRQGEGSGLGLGIVMKIISKHKGDITVDSVPGKTTFAVTLPIKACTNL